MYWYNICGTALSVTFVSLRKNLRISLINCLVLGLTSCSCGSFLFLRSQYISCPVFHGVRINWHRRNMDLLNRPPPLDFTGNVAENWRLFEQNFDVFVSAAHPKADKKTRSYILLNLAGREAIQRSKGFQYADGESSEDPDVLKQKFAELCKPKTNLTIQRHKFNTRNQGTNESFNAYLSDLKIKAASCMFGDLKNDLMVDRIVCGIQSDTVRKLLLRTEDLTLDKAVKICQIHELSETRVQELQKEKTEKSATVDAMGSTSSGRKSGNRLC